MSALLEDIEEAICDDNTLIDQYTRIDGITPLDIMLEKEKRRHIVAMLRFVMPRLNKKSRKVLWLYAVKGLSLVDIGKKLRITTPSVHERIERMHNKILKILLERPEYLDWVEALLPPRSKEVAHAPETRGYPFEIMVMVSVACVKVKLDGVMNYRNKWECRMPEYLQKSFGDEKSCCTLCGSCSKVENRKIRVLSLVA